MYNFFTFKKQLRLNNRLEKIKHQHIQESSHRKKLNSQLSETYRKRIEGFVMGMIDKPIQISEYKDRKYVPREQDTTKFAGASTLYFKGFRREKDRVEYQTAKNQVLDEVPFRNTSTHKFRDTTPNSPGLHYKPHTTIQRLEEDLSRQRHNELETYQSTDSLHQHNPNQKSMPIRRASCRNILPTLHQKTHFKSMITIYNEYPQGCFNSKIKPQKTFHDEEQPDVNLYEQKDNSQNSRGSLARIHTNTKKTQGTENFNPRQTSKQAMAKCNLLPNSPNNSMRLKSGQGKEIHSDENTYKQLYKTLYTGRVRLGFMR